MQPCESKIRLQATKLYFGEKKRSLVRSLVAKIYHRASFSYRKFYVLFPGFFCFFGGIVLLAGLIKTLFIDRPSPPIEMIIGLLLGALPVGICFLWVSIFLLRSYFKSKILHIKLSDEGIHYDNTFYPWSDIERVWVSWEKGGKGLHFRVKGNYIAYRITANLMPPSEECDDLIQEMRKDLAKFTNLKIG
jgi:hypothetical protein